MKAFKLIKALEEGRVIGLNHSKKPNQLNHFTEKDKDSLDFVEFLFEDKYRDSKYFERKGWASALGTIEQTLFSIYQNPEQWKVYFNSKEDFFLYWRNKCAKETI